jgi:hypothetical protein
MTGIYEEHTDQLSSPRIRLVAREAWPLATGRMHDEDARLVWLHMRREWWVTAKNDEVQ